MALMSDVLLVLKLLDAHLDIKSLDSKYLLKDKWKKKIENAEIFVFIFMIERYKIPHIYVSVQ